MRATSKRFPACVPRMLFTRRPSMKTRVNGGELFAGCLSRVLCEKWGLAVCEIPTSRKRREIWDTQISYSLASCGPAKLPAGCHWLRYFDSWDGSSYDCGDLADLRHQVVELVGVEGLRAVGQGFVGLMMDFYHQAVGAYGYGGARERGDFVALAGAVAGVDENWEMAEALHRGDDAQVERIAGVIGEGADAAFAKSDVVVAFAQNIFRSHEEFFERG